MKKSTRFVSLACAALFALCALVPGRLPIARAEELELPAEAAVGPVTVLPNVQEISEPYLSGSSITPSFITEDAALLRFLQEEVEGYYRDFYENCAQSSREYFEQRSVKEPDAYSMFYEVIPYPGGRVLQLHNTGYYWPYQGNGNHAFQDSLCIDLKERRILTVYDVFDAPEEEIRERLNPLLLQAYENSEYYALNYNSFQDYLERAQAFYVTEDSLSLLYSAYSIGPGMMGLPTLSVSLDEIGLPLAPPYAQSDSLDSYQDPDQAFIDKHLEYLSGTEYAVFARWETGSNFSASLAGSRLIRSFYKTVKLDLWENVYQSFLLELLLSEDSYDRIENNYILYNARTDQALLEAILDFLQTQVVDGSTLSAALADRSRILSILQSGGRVSGEDAQIFAWCEDVMDKALKDNSLAAFLGEIEGFAKVAGYLSDALTVLEGVEDVLDYVGAATAFLNSSGELRQVLRSVADRSQSHNPALASGVRKFLEAMEDCEEDMAKQIALQAVQAAGKAAADIFKDTFLSFLSGAAAKAGFSAAASAAGVLYLGYKAGDALSNIFFGTNKIAVQLGLLEAAAAFEEQLHAVMLQSASDLSQKKDFESARRFHEAVALYRNTQLYILDGASELISLLENQKLAHAISGSDFSEMKSILKNLRSFYLAVNCDEGIVY